VPRQPVPPDPARDAAARAAADLVEPGSAIGLGSGRAVWAVAREIGERLDELSGLRVVVGSMLTDHWARVAGLDIVELDGSLRLSVTIDGADEVDPQLGLLKGGGGALLREKIIVAAADHFICVAETPKKVERLGTTRGIPVEIVRFGWRDTVARLLRHTESAEMRLGEDGDLYVTDEGHFIVDCVPRATGEMADLARTLSDEPGVVEHGLFLTEADIVLLGRPDGSVERLERLERAQR
jgi:ribose 5-phosphate isomerase A